ncbi:hypothetical protein IQ268_11720 [Oculatella sp. LEGE 06141]|uniref:hypothetical protein n=1 Tax=Oculatella sp. LEGE 06141 TaxID=1828648 RepID=UPI0018818ACC|nr:hypothetical protein [Oculatella sp. LEGE 06141]MBE9179230.1 hypothetical protein [Oculatella sp. LEGE 06141]
MPPLIRDKAILLYDDEFARIVGIAKDRLTESNSREGRSVQMEFVSRLQVWVDCRMGRSLFSQRPYFP